MVNDAANRVSRYINPILLREKGIYIKVMGLFLNISDPIKFHYALGKTLFEELREL